MFRLRGEGRKIYPFYLQDNRLIVRQHRIFVSCHLADGSHVFVELEHFDKSWETIDNDKERFYFCILHLHELDSLPEGFAEGIWAKLAQQSE